MGVEKEGPGLFFALFGLVTIPLLVTFDGIHMKKVFSRMYMSMGSGNSTKRSKKDISCWVFNSGWYAALSLFVSAFAVFFKDYADSEPLTGGQTSDFYVTAIFFSLVYACVATTPAIMLKYVKYSQDKERSTDSMFPAFMYWTNYVVLLGLNICLTSLYYMFNKNTSGTLQLIFTIILALTPHWPIYFHDSFKWLWSCFGTI